MVGRSHRLNDDEEEDCLYPDRPDPECDESDGTTDEELMTPEDDVEDGGAPEWLPGRRLESSDPRQPQYPEENEPGGRWALPPVDTPLQFARGFLMEACRHPNMPRVTWIVVFNSAG